MASGLGADRHTPVLAPEICKVPAMRLLELVGMGLLIERPDGLLSDVMEAGCLTDRL